MQQKALRPIPVSEPDTKSKEGQTGNRQDNGSYLQGRLYNDRSKGVGQNIMEDDGRVLRADGSRSLNVVSAATVNTAPRTTRAKVGVEAIACAITRLGIELPREATIQIARSVPGIARKISIYA